MSTSANIQTASDPAVACTDWLGHCIVCGSDLLLEIYRGHPDNSKIHCNHCGTEVPTWLHQRRQGGGQAPDALKAELARIIKDAFYCGFDASDDHAFWFFDGVALADKVLERYWPNTELTDRRGAGSVK